MIPQPSPAFQQIR